MNTKQLTKLRCCGALCLILGGFSGNGVAATPVRTVSLQQGVNGYELTFEKRILASGTEEYGYDVEQYYLDGSPFANVQDDTLEILMFDGLIGNGADQVPAGATILKATLTFSTGTAAAAISNGPYVIGRLTGDARWSFYTDWPLDPPELRSARTITAQPWLAGVADVLPLEVLDADVTEFVQAWSDGEPNYGVTVFTNDSTDGWQFATIGNTEVTKRPKLVVEYTTETLTITDYTPTRSAQVRSNVATVDGATLDAAFLDYAVDDVTEALLFFDLLGEEEGRIGSQDEVFHAALILQTAGGPDYSVDASSNDRFHIHQMMVDWDTSTQFGVGGISEVGGEIAAAADQISGLGDWTRVSADVTSMIKNWQAGQENFGINVKPLGTDGWQMFWPGATDGTRVPTLRVWSVRGTGIPTAAITADSLVGTPPFTVAFDGSGSSDPQGQTLQYAWDFGDGQSGTGMQVNHEYTVAGMYDVTLTVKDPQGNEGTALTTVTALGAPTVVYTLSQVEGPEPLVVVADSTGSADPDGGPIEVRWDFGDGTLVTAPSATHTYRHGGDFLLTLTVTDDEGVVETRTETIKAFETSVESLTFQQGLNGYAGTFEMRVNPTFVELGQDVTQYYLDGRPQDAAQAANDTCELIRFDGLVGDAPGQIPAGAKIIRAALTFHTGTAAAADSDGPYVIGALNQPVDETTTYAGLDAGTGVAEEAGPRGSVDAPLLAGYADIVVEEVVTADISPIVQRWVNGDPNLGLAIFTDDTANGWQLATIGNPDVSLRPSLTVDYSTGTVNEYVFAPTQSAVIAKAAETLDGSLLGASYLDGGADADYKEGLYRFEPVFGTGAGQVKADERVLAAWFVLQTAGPVDNSDSDDPYSVHEMLETWDVTSNYGVDGISIEAGQAGPAVSEFIGMGETARAMADVTRIVYHWQQGSPEYGFDVKPQGSDGWQPYWPGLATPEQQPQLVVLAEKALAQPPPGARIIGVEVTAEGMLRITWGSVPDATYAIEGTADFNAWGSVATGLAPGGTQTTYEYDLNNATSPVMFFRILSVNP